MEPKGYQVIESLYNGRGTEKQEYVAVECIPISI